MYIEIPLNTNYFKLKEWFCVKWPIVLIGGNMSEY